MKITIVFETSAAFDPSVAKLAATDVARKLSSQLHSPVRLVLAEATDDAVPVPVNKELAKRRQKADEEHRAMIEAAVAAAVERIEDAKAETVAAERVRAAKRHIEAEAEKAAAEFEQRQHKGAVKEADAVSAKSKTGPKTEPKTGGAEGATVNTSSGKHVTVS